MTIRTVCRQYGLPEEVVGILEEAGIHDLYPPQAAALSSGVMEGENLLIAAPTASGKTLVAELCMLQAILRRGGQCLYIVPLRALASEKHADLRGKFSSLGIKVGIATGDFDRVDPALGQKDILVVTNEKADSLLRHRAPWLSRLSLVVLDEVHLLTDPARGPTLEVLVAKLRRALPFLQFLALSATVGNVEEIADWLHAKAVVSDFRPVPLWKGVYASEEVIFAGGTSLPISPYPEPPLALALATAAEGGQSILFVSTRRSAQALAKRLAKHMRGLLTEEEGEGLSRLSDQVREALAEPTRICRELAECVRAGVAFHHAGLHHAQRARIEEAFRGRLLKALCATTTLAFGVNLPARRVIIRDVHRYAPPFGSAYIPTLEFHQMAGRAGRPGLDPYGEAILIARDPAEREDMFARYVLAPPERIASKLGEAGTLAGHVLSAIASGYAQTLPDILSLFSLTLFAHQYGVAKLRGAILEALAFLAQEGMIIATDGPLATPFGELVSRLYIAPLSAVVLRDGLSAGETQATELGLLHLVAHTPDCERVHVERREIEELEAFAQEGGWLAPVPPNRFGLAEIKTALVLSAWITEIGEEAIYEQFGVGPGDLHRIAATVEWLLYSAERIAELFRFGVRPGKLRARVHYGVREELLPLVVLRGIGRVRARALYRAGQRTLSQIAKADVEALARVPSLGPEIARSIVAQANRLTRSRG